MKAPARVAAGLSVLVLAATGILYFRPPPPPDPPASAAYPAPASQFPVASVTDGDTFRIFRADGSSTSVRVLGVDAAELHPQGSQGPECYAEEAKQAAGAVLHSGSVQLSPDPAQPSPDRYGRELAYTQTADGQDLAELLLYGGFVRVYNAYPVSRTAHYLDIQRDAHAALRGGWSACGWTEAGR